MHCNEAISLHFSESLVHEIVNYFLEFDENKRRTIKEIKGIILN